MRVSCFRSNYKNGFSENFFESIDNMSRAVDTSDVILLQATDGAFPNEGNHSLNCFFSVHC